VFVEIEECAIALALLQRAANWCKYTKPVNDVGDWVTRGDETFVQLHHLHYVKVSDSAEVATLVNAATLLCYSAIQELEDYHVIIEA